MAADISGPEVVARYNVKTSEFVCIASLTAAQNAFETRTRSQTSGFQDSATDNNGNTYAIGKSGSTIAEVELSGNVSL